MNASIKHLIIHIEHSLYILSEAFPRYPIHNTPGPTYYFVTVHPDFITYLSRERQYQLRGREIIYMGRQFERTLCDERIN